MRIRIKHTTSYRYDQHVPYTAQLIRSQPNHHFGQRVMSWRVVSEDGATLPSTVDGYGNILHMLTRDTMHDAAAIIAEGEVETTDTSGVIQEAVETLPPLFFLRRTPATEPDDAITALAKETLSVADPVERIHDLMRRIRGRVEYDLGTTVSTTTAAEALANGSGVCQDHTQILLSAARTLGFPARYVSGYLWDASQAEPGDAGHAWAEVYIDGLGWVGFDVANCKCPDATYVRIAIGLDFLEAAPVRGVRRGIAEEELSVTVDIWPSGQLQQ